MREKIEQAAAPKTAVTCPYCGAKGFFQCAECGRTTCWNGETETVCEWCGNEAETAAEEKFDSITGGGF